MPRFHFNVHDGFVHPDPRGRELPNRRAAVGEATRLAAELLNGDADRVSLGETSYIEVTDSCGVVLFQLDLHVRHLEIDASSSFEKR